ncbi:MAG: ABC transporter ATP-binding protein [Gammaproteobacteria bacterium]|nr:ABC transporter ATP-binding protein [Gammaproteobacteria bacterium]
MIEADRLTRRYGEFVAVSDISFKIEPGEIVGLLGHNGAGKTTIMKMLTGFLEPSAGCVRVDGVQVEEDPLTVQARLGYLPESLPLYPELSVSGFLEYTAQIRGVDVPQAVAQAIARTELEEKALEPIGTLSRGFKQRLGVAQAILHEPQFLIMDEPTNGLDPTQTQHMRDLIKRLSSSATVILSTHIMQEVNAICDRVLILKDGELALDERLEDLVMSNQLQVRTTPEGNLLEVLEGITAFSKIIHVQNGNWSIDVDGDRMHAADQVAVRMVNAGLPVYELSAKQRDLETVFKEVNEGIKNAA